jgi:hypothetical protein
MCLDDEQVHLTISGRFPLNALVKRKRWSLPATL